MKRLITYLQQNKIRLITIIGIIAFIIFIIHFMNASIKQANRAKQSQQNNNVNTSKVQDVTNPNQSAISGTKIPTQNANQNAEFIREFVNNCNQKNYEAAYQMLSNNCKQVLYTDVNKFTNLYANSIFSGNTTYTLELIKGYTYHIIYSNDNLLATGGVSSNKNFSDYITIVNENNELKLNISNFINKQEMNREAKVNNNITIQINAKLIYMDYEIYQITVSNQTANTLYLTDMQTTNDIVLLDENENEHIAYISEIPKSNLIVKPYIPMNLTIKFNMMYQAGHEAETIHFKKIYTNYEEYLQNQTNENQQTIQAKVQL